MAIPAHPGHSGVVLSSLDSPERAGVSGRVPAGGGARQSTLGSAKAAAQLAGESACPTKLYQIYFIANCICRGVPSWLESFPKLDEIRTLLLADAGSKRTEFVRL